jgi:hypothetical protein
MCVKNTNIKKQVPEWRESYGKSQLKGEKKAKVGGN